MEHYAPPTMEHWSGRASQDRLYLHEKVTCHDLNTLTVPATGRSVAILGYACDEGVRRNLGRPGSKEGPEQIRRQLGKMPNHLAPKDQLLDLGDICCLDGNMEKAQTDLATAVHLLLQYNLKPIVLGGGHDMAYGHATGIRNFTGNRTKIGIVNFDAHLDLRDATKSRHSGTPFHQIALDCKKDKAAFHYLALGIRQDANDRSLFERATDLKTQYVDREHFNMHYLEDVRRQLARFMQNVDAIYATVDLDGFSSAYAPGVSAASPMGFSPDIVMECLKRIMESKKLIGLDIAEMNPAYDRDGQTAKLAASLAHYVIHNWP